MNYSIIGLLIVAGCASAPRPISPGKQGEPGAKSLKVVSFNAEEFFDANHDEGRDDYFFLPASEKSKPKVQFHCQRWPDPEACLATDWSESIFEAKAKNLAEQIKPLNADILILQEVENRDALLAINEHLGFKNTVFYASNHGKGLSQAVLSRLPVHSSELIPTPGAIRESSGQNETTSGILRVRLNTPDPMVILAINLPGPAFTRDSREEALKMLDTVIGELGNGNIIIAGGFNLLPEEDKEFERVQSWKSSGWVFAPLANCRDCLGSHYYQPTSQWTFFDMILISPALANLADKDQFQLFGQQGVKPQAFDAKTKAGSSSHWPIGIELRK